MIPKNIKDKHKIRNVVREGYAEIASGKGQLCCSSARSGHTSPDLLAKVVGYDVEDILKLPEGANMGLSCGNPIAIAALKEGQVVLDLGSGGGFDVFQAGIKVGKSGKAIGVDMTYEMLEKARLNIDQYQKRSGLNNVEFRLGEIEHLPVADQKIDVVISNCVINLSPDKEQVWSEIYRVLKKGGKAAVSDLALLKPFPPSISEMSDALVGCLAGAILIDDTKKILNEIGFSSCVFTAKPGYVEQMVEWQDPLYMKIIEHLPANDHISNYVSSFDIEVVK
jgi:arsenite methyltransferase